MTDESLDDPFEPSSPPPEWFFEIDCHSSGNLLSFNPSHGFDTKGTDPPSSPTRIAQSIVVVERSVDKKARVLLPRVLMGRIDAQDYEQEFIDYFLRYPAEPIETNEQPGSDLVEEGQSTASDEDDMGAQQQSNDQQSYKVPVVHPMASVSEASRGPCAVCLKDCPLRGDSRVTLRCSHVFCHGCLKRCFDFDHDKCPICRTPHLLDPDEMKTRLDSWRGAYSDWRRGGSHGACGGVEDAVTRVVAPQGRLMPMPEYESLLNVKKIEDAPQKEKNCSFATAVLEVKNTGIRHQRCAFLPPIS